MYLNNYNIFTAVIFNFLLSIQCRKSQEKSGDKVISIEVNDKLYKMYSMKKSWLEAVLECEDRNSDIAEINSIEAKFLARAMLKHRPTIESIWIGGFEESSSDRLKKVHDSRNKLDCWFLDCHLDGVAVMKSSCSKRRYVVCQNKSNLHSPQMSSTTIIINIHSTISSFVKNKTNFSIDNNFINNNNNSYQTSTSFAPFLSTTVPDISSTTNLPDLDSTEQRIKYITDSVVRRNELQTINSEENSKLVKQIKYSNVPKLYYAFEGPLLGKLEDVNNNELIDKKKITHKYQKYILNQSLKGTKAL